MLSPDAAATSPASTFSEHSSDSLTTRRKTRVSAEHTLNRVRENQRRHRARRRDHVAALEEKLAETEKLLADARAEIVALKAEQEAASTMCRWIPLKTTITPDSTVSDTEPTQSLGGNAGSNSPAKPSPLMHRSIDPQLGYLDVPTQDLSFPGDAITSSFFIPSTIVPLPPTPESTMSNNGPPPCCSDPPSSPLVDGPADPQCSTCKMRPAPAPSESTTLCAQAYVMISQQNFRNLDPETIRLWLAQGLRRAQREGEGCRVENGALLRLLDYISGL
ncbi:hypothetical protein T440DRAFT_470180 [Plenodomus tracheiphilus IPT5]|uniref:BZIP domain-containing protein n=1 Tax=Plenodomus tracheiphilus IPT5 TaxID=1408161 RepID=A0A6A7AZM8_9PLEO|nr:hypothetical protein T440DRAFT_470180 [Plenodomus tracheiphilus IPT5]